MDKLKEQPLVSIIIPLYNSEKFITKTIKSALCQTYQTIEIIVIDDGSYDNSLALVNAIESNKIKVFSQKNSGASVARNKGLEQAQGKYIQFLDADDLISPNKIEEQVKVLSEKPNHLALCNTVHFENGTDPYIAPIQHCWFKEGSENTVDFLIKLYGGILIGQEYGGMVQPNAWLTPRSLIDKAGLWNEMRNPDDDGEFFCRVLLNADGIIYTPNTYNYYRKFTDSNSLSAQNSEQSLLAVLKSTKLKAGHLLSKTTNPFAKVALSRLFWEIASSAYPSYLSIANTAISEANNLSDSKPTYLYTHTDFYRFISKYFGWKVSAWISYLKAKY